MTDLDLVCDVLVIGGGPAGAWTAIGAARAGADVLLVDKGYCGTSGAAAAAGVGAWYVPPTEEEREHAVRSRQKLGGDLAERAWVERVLDEVWVRMRELDAFGFPFSDTERPREDLENPGGMGYQRGMNFLHLQGPDLMRVMRRQVRRAGVRILDQSPVLQLLTDGSGAVVGAHGRRRQEQVDYRVRAGATVIATGGCAFLSHAIGTDVDTGDGYLFAAEAGAHLTGMEFSNAYSLGAKGTSASKGAHFAYGTFTREDGSEIEGAGVLRGRSVIARALIDGPVYCVFDQADDAVEHEMRLQQPNFMGGLDKLGIDPRKQRFEVDLILEGTVRGTGGIDVVTDDCATGVPGLFAAGDAATRQLICGGFTGGGSHNIAWAAASGTFAGTGAARYARAHGTAAVRTHDTARAGLAGTGGTDHREIVRAVQGEILPLAKNYFRAGDRLRASLDVLDAAWRSTVDLGPDADGRSHARSAVALAATGRWMYASALARTETRGMHRRDDFPGIDPAQTSRLLTGGLDDVWTRWEQDALLGAAS
ncbi:FAD-binding protein [Pseudonocardia ailaonensis]|uniref:FAD-binding protein n=1 Tax=Pseudonocardia ailaonensis TaxID=367279 RepID=A0ABN2MJI6_9PSEU